MTRRTWLIHRLLATVTVLLLVTTGCLKDESGDCDSGGGGGSGGGDSPSILGPSTLSVEELVDWYKKSGRPDPDSSIDGPGPKLEELVDLYVNNKEGVRGDLMFIQAVWETGGFTNADSDNYNFAGIGTYDGQNQGKKFDSVEDGVNAQAQLLHKVVSGNDVDLASADVSPNWGGEKAETWKELAGNWASDTSYWEGLSGLYAEALKSAGKSPSDVAGAAECESGGGGTCKPGKPADPSDTAVLSGDVRVHKCILDKAKDMLAAAKKDGITLGLNSGYRSREEQIALRRQNCGSSQYAIYEMPPGSCSPPTAIPGQSNHESGLAIDFAVGCGDAGFNWLKSNAAEYGFKNLPSECWHWSIDGR